VLRVAEQYAVTDTGRQRRANEDALLARAPLYVVADGMGGAQAGEVASRIAVESFEPGLADGQHPELQLAEIARVANLRIHERSHANAEQAGMGTTLTAVYVGDRDISIAHVGDSRAYCLRDGELVRLTEDHSLVDELMRQGRLTPEEAVEHPQRSVITRALGPESTVEVDTRSFRAQPGDVYLLCSDGLTTMLSEERILELLGSRRNLRDAGEALIAAANEAGGRDNITVVLIRLEDALAREHAESAEEQPTLGDLPALAPQQLGPVARRMPRRPTSGEFAPRPARRRRRIRHAKAIAIAAVVLGLFAAAGFIAVESVYFIGTNNRGLVTLFRGLPYQLPAGLSLYSSEYVSGVSAATLSQRQRKTLLDHSWRSRSNAASLIRSLEEGTLE
jgi:PPM family protein phosphatase